MDLGRGNDMSFRITANIQQLNQNGKFDPVTAPPLRRTCGVLVKNLDVCVERIGGVDDTENKKARMAGRIENSKKRLKGTMGMIRELDRVSRGNVPPLGPPPPPHTMHPRLPHGQN